MAEKECGLDSKTLQIGQWFGSRRTILFHKLIQGIQTPLFTSRHISHCSVPRRQWVLSQTTCAGLTVLSAMARGQGIATLASHGVRRKKAFPVEIAKNMFVMQKAFCNAVKIILMMEMPKSKMY